jgi:diguanylate cyclase (GGDEF)-like protein/PAS domain S-box-containing protein
VLTQPQANLGQSTVSAAHAAGDGAGGPAEESAYLTAVLDAQAEISSVEEPETLLRIVAERASALCGADGAAAALTDREEYVYRYTSGILSLYTGVRFGTDAGVLSYAVRTGEAYHCRDSETDPGTEDYVWCHLGARSMVVVPLRHGGQMVGLLQVVSSKPHAFRVWHVQALRVLGSVLAAALNHAAAQSSNRKLLAERTGAMGALRESEEKFRNAFESASAGIAIVALDGRWIRVNHALCEMLGYTERELLSTDFQTITHPDDLESDLASVRKLVSGSTRYYHLVKRYFHKLGHVVWVLLSASLVRDEHDRPLYFVSQILDITQRKQTEWLEDDRREVLEMVARHQPVENVLLRLCRMCERQVPGVVASLMLLQDGTLKNVAPNLPPDFTAALSSKLLTLAAALCARSELNGKFACCDVARDVEWSGYRETAFAHGLRGCWAAPVRSSDGDFLGMVVLYLRHLREPDEGGQRLLDQAAKLATLAIEHRELAQQLTHRAFHDPLTGLPNRVLFEERLELAVARARRNRTAVALVAVDLDRFKQVNDTLGHEAGDELLQQFAARMRATLRETDTVARVGGDEFMIVLEDVTDTGGPGVVARKLLNAMQAPFELAGCEIVVTASFGICVYPKDAPDLLALHRGADAAVYRSKHRGRNRYEFAADVAAGEGPLPETPAA